VDLSGNLLNIDGTFASKANMVRFSVNFPSPASYTPGLECTLFFKNPPFNRTTVGPPLLTLGLLSSEEIPIPYIVSPPFPWVVSDTEALDQSVTFKSDGANFNVVASGPAGWYGIPVLTILLNFFNP
jgi:hypothetical protein